MFPVSAYYLSSILNSERKWQIKGEVKLSNTSATLVTLENDDFITNTFQINRQSTNSGSFTLGGVCSTRVNLTLTYSGIGKMKSVSALQKGYCVKLAVWLKTSDPNQSDTDYSKNLDLSENTTGKVELGYFHIYNIKNSDYQCDLELYDAMLAFDRDITNQDAIYLYQGAKCISDWLELFCESCSTTNYQLSLADGVASKILNNEALFFIGTDSTLKNYRDAIGYLSILAGGFAIINRDGELDIEFYQTDSVLSVPHNNVMSYDVDDNLYRVAKLSTSIAGFDYSAYNSAQVLGALGAEIFLTENPFLRGIQPEDATELSTTIIDIIDSLMESLENVYFYGGSFEILGRPELDCGDCITINTLVLDKATDTMVSKVYPNVLICGHNWGYQVWSTVKCNSYVEVTASSKPTSSFKTASGGGGGGATNSTVYFVGTKDLTLQANRTITVFDILFLNKANISAHASVTITADIIQAGDVEFKILYDNVEYWSRPKWSIHEGYYTFSFDIGLASTEVDQQHSLIIQAISKASRHFNIRSAINQNKDNIFDLDDRVVALEGGQTGGTSDVDRNDYPMTSTIMSVAALDYQIVITASGVRQGEASWTGRYELADDVPQYSVGYNNPVKFTDFSENIDVRFNV